MTQTTTEKYDAEKGTFEPNAPIGKPEKAEDDTKTENGAPRGRRNS